MARVLETITKYRLAHRWTEYELSVRSGLPQSTISSWYRKEMTPSISSLEKICAAFDLTLAQFFAEEEEFSVLTPDQTQLLEQWMTLSAEEKHLLLQLISQGNWSSSSAPMEPFQSATIISIYHNIDPACQKLQRG